MKQFSLKSYDNLDSARDIIKETSIKLNEELEACNEKIERLFSKESFYGPIADHVEEALRIINIATKNNIVSLNNIANSIDKISNDYKRVDDKVSNDLGGI